MDLLIVDDSIAVRKVLQRLVRQAELPFGAIVEASDGQEALVLLRKQPVRVVLTDINMPNNNGLELLRCLKADTDLKRIPVIIVSTESGMTSVLEAAKLGAAGFIRKPFTAEQIREKLAQFC